MCADVPKLPPMAVESEEEVAAREEVEEERPPRPPSSSSNSQPLKNRHPSGPRTPDPYSVDDTSMMLPVFVAIGAFIPLLFCLCKL